MTPAKGYTEMKDSGADWIGKIPATWDISKIGTLYTQRNEKVSDKDYPPLSVTMKGILPQLATAAKTDDGDNRKLVRVGDFAINSRSDRRGSCGISPYDGSVSLINTILIPRKKMHPGYYDWLFHTTLFADEFYKWGHGIVDDLWTTRWQEMKRILVPVPPYETQSAIAAYLDTQCAKIDEIIAQAKASIEAYKQWKASIIYEAVTKGLDPNVEMKDSGIPWIGRMPANWTAPALKHLCIMQAGKNLISEQISTSGQYPVYGGNGQRGYYSDYNANGNFLLVGRQGALCGNVHYVSGKFWATEHAVVTTPSKITNIRYLYYLLIAMDLNQYASNSAAQPGLSVGNILNVKTLLPPIGEQVRISKFLDNCCPRIDEVITEKQSLIDDLESYKKSLIYEVVTGKRRVC